MDDLEDERSDQELEEQSEGEDVETGSNGDDLEEQSGAEDLEDQSAAGSDLDARVASGDEDDLDADDRDTSNTGHDTWTDGIANTVTDYAGGIGKRAQKQAVKTSEKEGKRLMHTGVEQSKKAAADYIDTKSLAGAGSEIAEYMVEDKPRAKKAQTTNTSKTVKQALIQKELEIEEDNLEGASGGEEDDGMSASVEELLLGLAIPQFGVLRTTPWIYTTLSSCTFTMLTPY